MSLIAAPDQAANLARDMVFDLERDHDSQISRGSIPRQAVQAARAAFRARVVAGLHPVFESALASSSLAREAESASLDPAAAADLPPSRVPRARTKVLAGVGMIAFFGVIIGWVVLTRHEAVVLARVPLPGAIGSGEVPLAVPGAAVVKLAVAADSVSYSGKGCLDLEAHALKGNAVVGRVSCCAWYPTHVRRARSGWLAPIYRQRDACNLQVPAGGADRLRVSTRFHGDGKLAFEGFEIRAEQ
jgi:hypothetical protein